ncbi:MAG: aminoacyl-tRNA hydrolase, partial [Verrucomicrobiota bacterium]
MAARAKLVIGLGNPGKEYVGTRHNVGFEVVERLAVKLDCSLRKKLRFAAQVGEVTLDSGKIMLAAPQTFMNRSGTAVAAIVKWSKVLPVEVLVIADDADLPLGQLRLRLTGGSGGHNGLRSIIDALGGNEEFARLRIGIGRTLPAGADISGHVLGRFSVAERREMDVSVATAVEAVESCLRDGFAVAMNRFNRRKE